MAQTMKSRIPSKQKFKIGDKIVAKRNWTGVLSVGIISDRSGRNLYHIVWESGSQEWYQTRAIDDAGYVLYDSPEGVFLRM